MSALALVGLAILSVILLLGGLLLGVVSLRVLQAAQRHPLADRSVPLVLLMASALMVFIGWFGLRGVSTALVGA